MERVMDEFYRFGSRVAISSSKRIRSKPFRADFEEIHTRKSTTEVIRDWGSLAQDSEGRTREDHFKVDSGSPSRTTHATTVWDAVTLTYYGIDQQTNQVQRIEVGRIVQARREGKPIPEGAPPECLLPTSPLVPMPDGQTSSKPLGKKSIESILCDGTLYTSESGDQTTELWFSDRLFRPVLEITRAKDFEITYRLFNVKLTEPDPSLFVVPAHTQ